MSAPRAARTLTAPGRPALVYDVAGSGPAIVLVHGYCSTAAVNWHETGWTDTLTAAGRTVIAPDLRGHGRSPAPHDPAFYDEGEMAADIAALIAAEAGGRADLMGYSMGGQIAMRLLADNPGAVRRAVIAGVGATIFSGSLAAAPAIAAAMRAASPEAVADPAARGFRAFAERNGQDLSAMAACHARPRRPVRRDSFASLETPVLVICGARDAIAGAPEPLAAIFPRGQAAIVPRRDHMSAVGDRVTKAAVLDFLSKE